MAFLSLPDLRAAYTASAERLCSFMNAMHEKYGSSERDDMTVETWDAMTAAERAEFRRLEAEDMEAYAALRWTRPVNDRRADLDGARSARRCALTPSRKRTMWRAAPRLEWECIAMPLPPRNERAFLVEDEVAASVAAYFESKGGKVLQLLSNGAPGADVIVEWQERYLVIEAKGGGSQTPSSARFGEAFTRLQMQQS